MGLQEKKLKDYDYSSSTPWTMDSVYAFKCKGFRNTRHTNVWNTIA
jgi:hypothetical protein